MSENEMSEERQSRKATKSRGALKRSQQWKEVGRLAGCRWGLGIKNGSYEGTRKK